MLIVETVRRWISSLSSKFELNDAFKAPICLNQQPFETLQNIRRFSKKFLRLKTSSAPLETFGLKQWYATRRSSSEEPFKENFSRKIRVEIKGCTRWIAWNLQAESSNWRADLEPFDVHDWPCLRCWAGNAQVMLSKFVPVKNGLQGSERVEDSL